MKNVTLVRQYNTDRRIQAIKAVRSATGVGLREAKDICDAVIGLNPGGPKRGPIPQTIAIYENRPEIMGELRANFEVSDPVPVNSLFEGRMESHIAHADVLALMFEALAFMDVSDALTFRNSAAFLKVEAAL